MINKDVCKFLAHKNVNDIIIWIWKNPFAETVKAKTTANDADFITYSNTICFSSILLYYCGYLINQWKMFMRGRASSWFKNVVIRQIFLKVEK